MKTEQFKLLKEMYTKAHSDLVFFTNEIFSKGFKEFKTGDHVDMSVGLLEKNLKTARVSAKDHFKSTSLYAHFMHRLMFEEGKNYFYFSYMDQMSAYHIAKIKEFVKVNPFFQQVIDYKPTAEGVIKYGWPGKEPVTLKGKGMLAFKKGIHCDGVYVDDPFQEEQKKLTGEQVKKINNVFRTEIMDMPKQGGFLHVVGTAQTYHDFFFDEETMGRFEVRIMPAIKDYARKITLWPEHMDWDELQLRRRERGDKVFNQEYLCRPSWAEDAFFKREQIMERVNPKLKPLTVMNLDCYVVGGWDPGKRVHPAHVAVFAQYKEGFWTQVYEKWFDGVPYSEQLRHVKDLIERLRIDEMGYDATRGEFETEQEKGELPMEMVPIVFKARTKVDMATNFDTMVSNGEVELLNRKRYLEQILCVDNDLKAPESPGGHGDCYDSKTEVLTEVGWKFFKDVSISDKICTLGINNYIEYQTPTNIIIKDYSGKMYEINTVQVSLLVTPRHKLLTVGRSENKLRFPEDVFHKQVKMKKSGVWEGKNKEFFVLEKSRLLPETRIRMVDWLEFIGIYLAEGHTTKRARRRYQVGISQEGEGRERIRCLLKKLPFKFTENKKGFWIYESRLGVYLHKLGKSWEKFVPKEFLNLPKEKLEILFDALMFGDGTIQKTFSVYYTSSKQLADDVQEILLKIGLSGNIYVRDYRGRKAPHGVTNRVHYCVSVIIKNTPLLNKRKSNGKFSDKWADYAGKIYCVTVPNQVIYVRRNGKPVWSGNSFMSTMMALHLAKNSTGSELVGGGF